VCPDIIDHKEMSSMTYGDILIEAMAEATGETKEELTFLLGIFRKQFPKANLDDELSDEEATALLEKLRKDKDGIRELFTSGELPQSDCKSGDCKK
jgi:hypothetical protein